MAYCTISGNVVDFDGGTLQPGAILKVFKVLSQAGSVISSTPRQYTFLAGGSWSPALRFERDSYAYIYLNAPGFDTNKETGIPLAIPNTATATLASLSADVNLPTEVPVVLQDLALNVVIADNVETADTYATLPDAITAIGSNVRTLVISSQQNLTDDLTVPKNVTTSFTGEGSISIASGKTLTINGPLVAAPRQIFSGSGSVLFGGAVSRAHLEWFCVCDGTTDDAAAAQKAIDAFTPVGDAGLGGELILNGYMAIGSTLTIAKNNVVIRGFGWSSDNGETRLHSTIKWIGSAGSPMILIHAVGSGVKNLRLKGKSAAAPSAAIEISDTTTYLCDNSVIEDVWIGAMYGYDADDAVQFTRGIYFSGGTNSDTNYLKRVFIYKATTGIELSNTNASLTHCETLQTIGCTTGVKTSAAQLIITNWINASNDVDLEMAAQGVDVTLRNYVSEGSGRMATASVVGPLRLVVDGGSFQADGSSGAKFETGDADYSGKRAFLQFKGTTVTGLWLELRNFNLQQVSSPATPVIQAWNTSDNTTPTGATQVFLRLDGVKGFTSANIDLGSDGYHSSNRTVEFIPQANNSPVASQQTRFIQNSAYGSEDGVYEDLRYDFTGKVNVYGGYLKVKQLPQVSGSYYTVTATGSGGTTYSYIVSALTYDGESLPSAAKTCTNGTLGTGGRYNTIAFAPVVGAKGYKIYGRSAGTELLMKTLTVAEVGDTSQVTWVDDGSVTPSGALPTINTTGNAKVEGIFAGGKGVDVASATTIVATGNVFHVTGTTTITSVSGTGIAAGTEITIIFDGALTFTDGSNLKLNGNFSTSADDTIKLVYDGSNWYEVSRSTN